VHKQKLFFLNLLQMRLHAGGLASYPSGKSKCNFPRAISSRLSWIAFPYTRHIAFITLRLPFADARITLCGAAMI
jgi:hypothetical protein